MIRYGRIALIAGVAWLLAACGTLDDVTDTVETVDQAVSLLQDIEDNGTQSMIDDGLDALYDQVQGYAAVLRVQQSEQDAGDSGGTPEDEVLITLQVDAARNALIQVTRGDQTDDYFISGFGDSQQDTHGYRVQNGRYACADGGDDLRPFDGGLPGVFAHFAVTDVNVRVLSVTAEDNDDTVAGRDVTHYELESKVPDALALLETIDNDTLQTRVEQAGAFTYAGDLYLDDETGALMEFTHVLDDLDAGRRTEFAFTVTVWDIPEIPTPAESAITEPCN